MIQDKNNPLHAFANWVTKTPSEWSDIALTRAHDAIIDTVACMVPGAKEDVSQKVYSLAEKWGTGRCNAVGFKTGLSAPMAALVNGTSAHALDFDDNFDPAKAHASAVLVPALLAIADEYDANGVDILDAYIVGLQIIGLVGQGVNPYHRNRGWHATATVGAVGSAAGCARLMKLDRETTAHAISLATSMAGGFMSQFGTMAKPVHAGLAAAGAVKAAQFATAGITAGAETLHGEKGMGTLMVGPDVEELRKTMAGKDEHGQKVSFRTENIGEPLHIEKYGLKTKRFPNCGSVHRALDGLLALKQQHAIDADAVDRILVRAPASHLRNLMYETPTNPMEAKFSLEYNLAVGLKNGNVGLADFENTAITLSSTTDLMPLINREYVEQLETEFHTEVHIFMKSGEKHHVTVDMPIGSSANPLTRTQLWDKLNACIEPSIEESSLTPLTLALKAIPTGQSIRKLTRLLATA